MSLLTPFGPLKDLPLDDIEQLKEILVRSDKSRMLEGLVIEAVFNEYLAKLAGQGVEVLPVSLVRTLTVKAPPNARRRYVTAWWLWDHSTRCVHARALGERLAPGSERDGFLFDCYFDEPARDFFIKEWNGQRDIPIQAFMQKKRGLRAPPFRMPAESVIDEQRSQQAFWAGISSHYSRDLFKRVVLHRLFKNCAIQPFFDGVWDIDSLARLPNGDFIQLEVKHKYPRAQGPEEALSFGINDGQLRVMRDLARRGIKTLHMIMVKPVWDKHLGTGYLLNRVGLRKNVLMLAKLMDAPTLDAIMQRPSRVTGREQSFTGRHQQKARYVLPAEFQLLGSFDDPVDQIAGNIHRAAAGALDRPACDDMLKRCRTTP